jgi:hypothetical protein
LGGKNGRFKAVGWTVKKKLRKENEMKKEEKRN